MRQAGVMCQPHLGPELTSAPGCQGACLRSQCRSTAWGLGQDLNQATRTSPRPDVPCLLEMISQLLICAGYPILHTANDRGQILSQFLLSWGRAEARAGPSGSGAFFWHTPRKARTQGMRSLLLSSVDNVATSWLLNILRSDGSTCFKVL